MARQRPRFFGREPYTAKFPPHNLPVDKKARGGKGGALMDASHSFFPLNLLQHADGLKDGGGGFNALVAGLGARAFDGLLDVVRSQQAEAHRHAAFEGHMGKARPG